MNRGPMCSMVGSYHKGGFQVNSTTIVHHEQTHVKPETLGMHRSFLRDGQYPVLQWNEICYLMKSALGNHWI